MGVSEELNSVETRYYHVFHFIRSSRFQKNLIVWKLKSPFRHLGIEKMFQKNLIVWKLCAFHICYKFERIVSEELNSVETHILHN